MKITYDHAADAAYIELTDHPTVKTKQINPFTLLHFDQAGDVRAIELLNVRKQGIDPLNVVIEQYTLDMHAERPDPARMESQCA